MPKPNHKTATEKNNGKRNFLICQGTKIKDLFFIPLSLPAIICKYPWEIFPIEGFHGEKNGDDIHVKIASTSAAASKQYID